MKPLWAVAIAIFLTGCAADTPPAQEVRDQFQSDFPDRGQFAPIDHPETPNIGPRGGGPAPR